MKVKIIKCSSNFWYHNRIGETFKVLRTLKTQPFHVVDSGDKTLFISLVLFGDCEVVSKYEKEDFTFTSDQYGYMIKYKGKNIGGASVMGKPKMHWQHARMNRKDNLESAKREIEQILNGHISPSMQDTMNSIDNS